MAAKTSAPTAQKEKPWQSMLAGGVAGAVEATITVG